MYWTIGKTVSCKQIRPTSVFRNVKWIFDASRGFIGLDVKYIQICETNIYCYLNFTNQSNVVDVVDHNQGLTQTFSGSGPQDHQLRESGGPTIFLVVLRIKSRHTNSYAYIIKKWVS